MLFFKEHTQTCMNHDLPKGYIPSFVKYYILDQMYGDCLIYNSFILREEKTKAFIDHPTWLSNEILMCTINRAWQH